MSKSHNRQTWIAKLLPSLFLLGTVFLSSCAALEVGMYEAVAVEPVATEDTTDSYRVVSFNIQFLGFFKKKDHAALAEILARYDLIFIQELVAPPYAGVFPDGSRYRPDAEAEEFFDAMANLGFDYVLSDEDTGTNDTNHNNGSATEWFVAFYNPTRVVTDSDLPTEFLGTDRTNHPDYERVPHAFGFELGSEDLVFISVHLQPGSGSADRARRAHEHALRPRTYGSNVNSIPVLKLKPAPPAGVSRNQAWKRHVDPAVIMSAAFGAAS